MEAPPIDLETARIILRSQLRLLGVQLINDLDERGLMAPDCGARLDREGTKPGAFPFDSIDLEQVVSETLYLLRLSNEPPNANYPGYKCPSPDENDHANQRSK